MNRIKVIAFDGDDTLWVNEPYYQAAEKLFCNLLSNYMPVAEVSSALFKTEMSNLEKYGYGAKSVVLSMVETALRISNRTVSVNVIEDIINIGKSLLDKPVELLEGVEIVLGKLKSKYILIVATKGDLLDQSRKLNGSGIIQHFQHTEIMHDKNELEYKKLIARLNIKTEEFLMVGNSLKSDVFPVISIGGKAVYIPYHVTWQHETADDKTAKGRYHEISKITELINILN